MELFLNPNPRKQFIVQKVTAVLRVGVWVLRMLSGCPIWECLVQVPAGLPITAGVDPGVNVLGFLHPHRRPGWSSWLCFVSPDLARPLNV